MKTAFFGTPPIAVASLRALYEVSEVSAVVCQPDRPAGRGLRPKACAVKEAALELGLEVHQPTRVRKGNLHDWLAERGIDLAIVLAYGRILPPETLAAPRLGCVNLHASLLPKYRGAAPINWAIAHGETETGITLMQMDEGLDTGPILAQHALAIAPEWDAGDLARSLGALSAEVVKQRIPDLAAGRLTPIPQDHAQATYAPPISAADTAIDFSASATEIHNRVRAFSPRPGSHTLVEGKRLKLLQTCVVAGAAPPGPPGTVWTRSGRILVTTGDGSLEIVLAQLEGRRPLAATDLLNGRALQAGQRLGQ